MTSRVPISIWRKQEVLQWIDKEGGQVPTRAIKVLFLPWIWTALS
ncbi:hypothetical protein PC120_g614 [Phytophthora cactorum]|nr:hypothetical protein PC120_g614 [Phytophthora cactorum]